MATWSKVSCIVIKRMKAKMSFRENGNGKRTGETPETKNKRIKLRRKKKKLRRVNRTL